MGMNPRGARPVFGPASVTGSEAGPSRGLHSWAQRVFVLSARINPAKGNGESWSLRWRPAMAHVLRLCRRDGIARVHDVTSARLPTQTSMRSTTPCPMVARRWTRAALAAGKHVLCEKPFTANAAEAREVPTRPRSSDRVVMGGRFITATIRWLCELSRSLPRVKWPRSSGSRWRCASRFEASSDIRDNYVGVV